VRIESINLTQQVFEEMGVGLPTLPMNPLSMRGLGQCVVIAGKNGSGKTRLLTLLEQISVKYLITEERREIGHQIARAQTAYDGWQASIKELKNAGPRNGEQPGQMEEWQRNSNVNRLEIERLGKLLSAADVLGIHGSGKPKIVPFVPRSTSLGDPAEDTEKNASQIASSFANSLSSQGADSGAPAYARQVFRAAIVERGRKNSDSPAWSKQGAEKELLDLLTNLLGDDIKFELDDELNIRLEGLGNKYSSLLSDGQKVLFQLACMLHSRHASLKDCIVFLDEPENHLHPAVLNEIVDRLLDLLPDGQLWIATHSVPLIAHLTAKDPNYLWFAEGGRFRPAGRTPEAVLDSLLGGPSGARRVNELTMLPFRFASSLFLRQCLLVPGVVDFNEGDAQLLQIQKELNELRVDGKPLCVIDFGAGKGRLLEAMAQESSRDSLKNLVDYIAYEPHGQNAEACQRLSSSVYGSQEDVLRAFSSLDQIRETRGEKFADVVVVCNVLHEMHPDKWIEEFGRQSLLSSYLKDDGYLLFVEDYALPVGERAHEYGFLLLDQDQLCALFDITDDDVKHKRFTRNVHPNSKYQRRLIAHLVSARCLSRMTEKTKWTAIQSLNRNVLDRLKELLAVQSESNIESEFGRESALVTQLVANSSLWLRDHPPLQIDE
jgi:energy-coupling factor transporter ATP-binding protein EcfA2